MYKERPFELCKFIFEPLGIVNPSVLEAKPIIQGLWKKAQDGIQRYQTI